MVEVPWSLPSVSMVEHVRVVARWTRAGGTGVGGGGSC